MSEAIQFPETRVEAVADEGSIAAAGLNVLVLAADGRVHRKSTFVDSA
jgi:hypothetical protein